MDPQLVELLGRNRLTDELVRAGLEVGRPIRDRGIDLIAYADLESHVEKFIARPIQMKAASTTAFGVDKKYSKFPNLILAYVWNLQEQSRAVTYAMTYREAVSIADELGWTRTPSWEKKAYTTSHPSKKLLLILEKFKMTPDKWWLMVTGLERRAPQNESPRA